MAGEPMQDRLPTDRNPIVEQLVTVATFMLCAEAEALKLLLERQGIRAVLADDNRVRTNGSLSNAVGGAKLQVAATDADQARKILDHYQASQGGPPCEPSKKSVTFACQDCGKSITFPAERSGHVETCPACGAFVDVPNATKRSLSTDSEANASQPIAREAEPLKALASESRTSRQLWIEVFAVLCLAYFPYLFTALYAIAFYGPGSANALSVHRELFRILNALEVSLPLLVILALAKDRWSLFGIVRPAWISDALIGCIICVSGHVVYVFVTSLLPVSLMEKAADLPTLPRPPPEGTSAYLLLPVACLAGAFAEELVMRGYLIARLERLLGSTWLPVLITSACLPATTSIKE